MKSLLSSVAVRMHRLQKKDLMERFELSDVQAQAIVEMCLRALTGLEREKLEKRA